MAWQIDQKMKAQKLTQTETGKCMHTRLTNTRANSQGEDGLHWGDHKNEDLRKFLNPP
jgi:hypothetical protein